MRLLTLSFLGIVGFALLIFAARVLGDALPLPKALTVLHLTDCTLPCWDGITLGETQMGDAFQRISAQYQRATQTTISDGSVLEARYATDGVSGTFQLFADSNGTAKTVRIHLNSSPAVTVGDIVTLFGEPNVTYGNPPITLTYQCESFAIYVASDNYVVSGWKQPIVMISISHVAIEMPGCAIPALAPHHDLFAAASLLISHPAAE